MASPWLGGRAGLARVNGHGPVFFREILVGHALHVGGGHGLNLRPGLVDFAPVAFAVVANQVHEDRVIGREPAVFGGGEVVLHLLQFLRRHLLLLQLLDVVVNALLDFLGRVAFLGLAAGVEEALPFHRGLVGIGLRGDAAAQHQALVEPAGARGQNLRQDFQRIRVAMLERHRVPEDVHLRVGLGLGVHALLGQLLHFERHHVRRGLRAARDALEILLRQRLGLGRARSRPRE